MKKNYLKFLVMLFAYLVPILLTAQVKVLEEGFENGIPSDWEQYNESGTNKWTVETGNNLYFPRGVIEGNSRAYFPTNNTNSSVTKLITPILDGTNFGDGTPVLSFYYALSPYSGGANDILRVYGKGGGTTWKLLEEYTAAQAEWRLEIINLPVDILTEEMQIAFEGVNNSGRGIVLDQIYIGNLAECTTPTGLSVMNVTYNSALLVWNTGSAYGTFNLKASNQPITDFSETAPIDITDIGSGNRMVNGLESNTTYYFYVQADCYESGISEWSNAGIFKTGCAPVETFVESFETYIVGSGQDIGCWYSALTYNGDIQLEDSYFPQVVQNPASGNKYTNDGEFSFRLYGHYESESTYSNNFLVAPSIAENVDISQMQLRFSVYAESNEDILHIGFQTIPEAHNGFEELQAIHTSYGRQIEEFIIPLSDYNNQSTARYITFYVSGRDSERSATFYIDNIRLEPLDDCENTSLSFFDVEVYADYAEISWTDIFENSKWNIKVSESPIDPQTVEEKDLFYIKSNLTSPEIIIPNLNAAKIYYFYVQMVCDDIPGLWSKEQFFVTPCGKIKLPYFENFDYWGVSSGLSNIARPACWNWHYQLTTNNQNNINNYGWYPSIVSEQSVSNGKSLGFYVQGTSGYNIAVLPEFDIENIRDLELQFNLRLGNTMATFAIGAMSDPDDPETFDEITSIKRSSTTTFGEYIISLEEYKGEEKHVAFKINHNTTSSTTSVKSYIDDLKISKINTCKRIDVSTIIIDTITAGSVTISFEPAGTETLWDIAYGKKGFDIEEIGTYNLLTEINKNQKVEISGLESSMIYDFYIRANCGENSVGYWVAPVSAETNQIPATLPYYCGFEDTENEDPSKNWTFLNGLTTNVNNWIIGSSTSYEGRKSLYVSNDGIKNEYTNTSSTTFLYAERYITIEEEGLYESIFYWNANGGTVNNSLRAFLVPANVELTDGAANAITTTTAVPSGWMDLASGPLHSAANEQWQKCEKLLAIYEPGEYKLVFFWRNDNVAPKQGPAAVDNISFKLTTTGCMTPENLIVTNRTTDSFTLDFDVFNVTQWQYVLTNKQIDVNSLGSIPESVIEINETSFDKPYTFTGLDAGVKYHYYFRSTCNNVWLNDSVITHCDTKHSLPYVENFDSYTTTEMSPCWSVHYNTSLPPRVLSSSPSPQGGNYLYLGGSSLYAVAVTGQIEVDDISTQAVSFWSRNGKQLVIGVMDHPDDMETFIAVDTVIQNVSNTWEFKEVSLEKYKDKGNGKYLAFAAINIQASNIFYIDFITVDSIPDCYIPTNLVSEDIRLEEDEDQLYQATLSWNGYGSEKFHVKVSTVALENLLLEADAFDEIVEGESVIVKGLDYLTTYYYYVRAVCGDDYTDWAKETRTFTTDCPEYFNPRFKESFDTYGTGGSTLPSCWTRLLNYTSSSNVYPRVDSSTPNSSPGSLYFNTTSSTKNLVATPMLNVDDISLYTVSGVARSAIGHELAVGILEDIEDPDSFVPIDTIRPTVGNSYQEFAISLSSYKEKGNGNGKYVAFYAGRSANNQIRLDDLLIEIYNPCPMPKNVAASRISSTSARLSWNGDDEEAVGYEIKYLNKKFNPEVETEGVTTLGPVYDTREDITGLEPNTTYYFYVRSLCDTINSYWSDDACVFTTLCSTIELPYVEHFDTYGTPNHATSTTLFPTCWRSHVLGFGTSPKVEDICIVNVGEGGEFPSSLYLSPTCSISTTRKEMIYYSVVFAVLPEMKVDNIRDCQISFNYKGNAYGAELHVGILSDWEDPSLFIPIDTIRTDGALEWNRHITNLRSYTGTGKHIAFRSSGEVNIFNNSVIYIGSVVVESIPACAAPYNIKVNIETNSVEINWTAGNENSIGWDYVITEKRYDLSNGDTWDSINKNPFDKGSTNVTSLLLNNLMGGNTYYFYIKSQCSDEAYYPGIIEFIPHCALEIPYEISFNGLVEKLVTSGTKTSYIPCWHREMTFLYSGSIVSPRFGTHSAAPAPKDTVLDMLASSSTGYCFAISPELVDVEANTLRAIIEMASPATATQSTATLIAGVMTDKDDIETFTPVDTVSVTVLPDDFKYIRSKFYFNRYEGEDGKYLAFRTIDNSVYVKSIKIEEIPDPLCDEPLFINWLSYTDETIVIEWDEEGASWEIACVPKGTDPEDADNYITANENTDTIKGLEPNTTYNIYVRTICGEHRSIWSDPTTLTTRQKADQIPFICDFSDPDINAGWAFAQDKQENQWIIGTEATYEGYSLYVSNDSSSYAYSGDRERTIANAYHNSWAYRTIELPAGKYTVTYRWKNGASSSDFLRVMLAPYDTEFEGGKTNGVSRVESYAKASDNTCRFVSATPAGWTNLSAYINTTTNFCDIRDEMVVKDYGLYSNASFTEFKTDVEITVPGKYHLVFFWRDYYSLPKTLKPAAIDYVSVTETEECTMPVSLKVVTTTQTSAYMTWKSYNAEKWPLVVSTQELNDPAHAEHSAGTVFFDTVRALPACVPGLLPNTTYHYYVMNPCDESANPWAHGTFTTLCPPVNEKLYEDFEGETFPPECWTRSWYKGFAKDVFNENNINHHIFTEYNWTIKDNTVNLNGTSHAKMGFYDPHTPLAQWFLTPLVKLSDEEESLLYFDMSYTQLNNASIPLQKDNERFMVMVSTDEGVTWKRENAVIWGSAGEDYDYLISDIRYGTYTTEVIDLSKYKGNTIQIAFYIESREGINTGNFNAIRIDNISIGCAIERKHKDVHFEGYDYNGYGFAISKDVFDFDGDTTFTRTTHFTEGCDSIITLNLRVHGTKYTYIKDTICEGEVYTKYGFNKSEAGTHTQYTNAASGADSIVELTLTVNAGYEIRERKVVCPDALPIPWFEQMLTKTDTYTHTLKTTTGCDSIFILDFQAKDLREERNITICTGSFYRFDGKNLTEQGTYYENHTTKDGCDSTITLHLSVVDEIVVRKTETICYGGSFTGYGWNELTEANIYESKGTSIYDCDSTFILDLRVVTTLYETIEATICEGERYTENGFDTDKEGENTLPPIPSVNGGCDSIVTLYLTIAPVYTTSDEREITENDLPYRYNNHPDEFPVGTTSGVYPVVFKSIHTCDSTVMLNLIVNKVTGIMDISADDLIIEPNPVLRGGKVYINYTFTAEELQGLSVEVYNSSGVCIKRFEPKSEEIYISDLDSSGIYLVRVKTGTNKELYGKIIVK